MGNRAFSNREKVSDLVHKSRRTLSFYILLFLYLFSEISVISMNILILKVLSVKGVVYTSGQISCHPQGSGDTKQTGVTQAVCTQLEDDQETAATAACRDAQQLPWPGEQGFIRLSAR